jgi:AcrR family transcriptional regulator
MDRKRLTREEGRAQTHARLLEAAEELFIKKGIEEVTIEDVAETAGFSRGAFYSNFKSKDELICAVLDARYNRNNGEIERLFADEMSPMERLAAICSFYFKLACDLSGCAFWMSMQLYALRHERVRPKVLELLQIERAQMVEYVRRIFAELGKAPPAPPEVIAFGLLAQAYGVAISQIVDPSSISVDQIEQALGLYFDRLVGL